MKAQTSVLANERRRVFFSLFSIYAVLLASECINFTFLPVYLSRDLAMNHTKVGILISMGSVVTIFAQNFWGVKADRSKSKNRILAITILGTGFFSLFFLFPSIHGFWSLFAIISFMFVFFLSEQSLCEAITLEKAEKYHFSYGTIRCAGSLGYSLCALILSFIPGITILQMFFAFTLLTFAMLIPLLFVPKTPGLQKSEKRAGMLALLKIKPIKEFMIYVVILYIFLNFSSTFYTVRFTELGGSNGLLSLFVAIGTIVQVPILLYAEKLFSRFNFYYLFLFVGYMTVARLITQAVITNVNLLIIPYLMQAILGVIFIYCGVLFISQNCPPELRATGQSMWLITIAGISVVIGNTFGGIISDAIGNLPVSFLLFGGLVLLLCAVYTYVFKGKRFYMSQGVK